MVLCALSLALGLQHQHHMGREVRDGHSMDKMKGKWEGRCGNELPSDTSSETSASPLPSRYPPHMG